jgi:hypothetical protein
LPVSIWNMIYKNLPYMFMCTYKVNHEVVAFLHAGTIDWCDVYM